MFYLVTIEREIKLAPKHFGPRLHDTLIDRLQQEAEGTCTGRYGYIVSVVIDNVQVGKGKIDEDTGFAHFVLKFHAIVCRPFKNEVLDAIVTTVNKVGFFAEAGPLKLFVSNRLMPPGMSFDTNGPPSYVNESETKRISADDVVRLKIVGTRIDSTEIFCIASIRGDYLGVME